ncbi:MAG: hypothetical protein AAGU11_21390, partial [Syntrophobacteraceae bacterium]
MKRLKTMGIYVVIALLAGFTVWSFDVKAVEVTPDQRAGRAAMEKGLRDSLGMPVLTGDLWQ